jgi:hypothetical protein
MVARRKRRKPGAIFYEHPLRWPNAFARPRYPGLGAPSDTGVIRRQPGSCIRSGRNFSCITGVKGVCGGVPMEPGLHLHSQADGYP